VEKVITCPPGEHSEGEKKKLLMRKEKRGEQERSLSSEENVYSHTKIRVQKKFGKPIVSPIPLFRKKGVVPGRTSGLLVRIAD